MPEANIWPTKVVSPDGQLFSIPYRGAEAFAREHGIGACGLAALIRGDLEHHKGWTLADVAPPPSQYIVSPEGVKIKIPHYGVAKFARQYGLHPCAVVLVIKGKQKEHRGWTQHKEPETHEQGISISNQPD